MSDQPALEPPPGQESQFENPPNRNPEAYAGIIICIFLICASAVTRASFMILTRKLPKIEDYLAIAAFGIFFSYVYAAFWFMNICGYYVHQWDVRLRTMSEIFYIIHVCTFLFESMMMAIKVAILLEWIRIFAPSASITSIHTRDSFVWVCRAVMVLNILYYSSVIIAGNLACTPYERIWDKSVPGTCSFDTRIVLATSAGINLVSDLVILVVPQGKIWHLRMSTKKKLSVSVVFSIGLIACASAAVRLWAGINAFKSEDQVYSIAPVALWCMVEMTCAFMVFCVPAVPKVFGTKGLVGKLLGLASSSTATATTREYNNSAGTRNRHYQKVEDDTNGVPLPLRSLSTNDGKRLTRPTTAESREALHQPGDRAILRTTRVEIHNEEAADQSNSHPSRVFAGNSPC